MFLDKLTVINFKNYSEATLQFDHSVNCFIGTNGSGKTNLLDAIHYLSMTKSYFTSSDSQNIRHDEAMFIIQGEFERNDYRDSVMCSVRNGQKKQFKLNGEEYERLSDHIGAFPVVMIAPTDHELITEGSGIRRKFIDSIISQYDHEYLERLIRYNQVLLQRNTLLKQAAQRGTVTWGHFAVWDEQLIILGQKIHEKRKEFLKGFEPLFNRLYAFITDSAETVSVLYESQLSESSFDHLMNESRSRDFDQQFTTTGIHKDDLTFLINGYPVRKFASQGQQRSYVVALKLAQFSYLCDLGFTRPIVLLDDIFDKLDSGRVAKLMKLVSGSEFGQLFITDTHKERMMEALGGIAVSFRIFDVVNGNVATSTQQEVES
jgi:DNA replication and repair protein RecF